MKCYGAIIAGNHHVVKVVAFDTDAELDAFGKGIALGADLFGSFSVDVYTIQECQEILNEEDPDDVPAFKEAISRIKEQIRLDILAKLTEEAQDLNMGY